MTALDFKANFKAIAPCTQTLSNFWFEYLQLWGLIHTWLGDINLDLYTPENKENLIAEFTGFIENFVKFLLECGSIISFESAPDVMQTTAKLQAVIKQEYAQMT